MIIRIPHPVTGEHVPVTATNAHLHLFGKNSMLDHLTVKVDGGLIVCFDTAIVHLAFEAEECPITAHFDQPQWAIDLSIENGLHEIQDRLR